MYTTYHLSSAQEVTTDLLDSIKATFKSKPITIVVEEDDDNCDLSEEAIVMLNERLEEYKRNPQSGKSWKEVEKELKAKYDL